MSKESRGGFGVMLLQSLLLRAVYRGTDTCTVSAQSVLWTGLCRVELTWCYHVTHARPLSAQSEEYASRFACHLDAFHWVNRDSYLPQGSRGLKAVTKHKVCGTRADSVTLNVMLLLMLMLAPAQKQTDTEETLTQGHVH